MDLYQFAVRISQMMREDGYAAPEIGERNIEALPKVMAYIEALRSREPFHTAPRDLPGGDQ